MSISICGADVVVYLRCDDCGHVYTEEFWDDHCTAALSSREFGSCPGCRRGARDQEAKDAEE
jgi:hypothetical protein